MLAAMTLRIVVLALFLPALLTPAAMADSIVYEKDGNIWQAAPDGSRQTQITTAGGYARPTQADDGTVVAVKDKLLQRMDRGGRVLNTAGDNAYSGPFTPHLSPSGQLVAYSYLITGVLSPGMHTTLSYSTRPTARGEIFDIGGWGNPSWIGNDRVLMFDASETFTGDTLIYTVGGGATQTWYEDPDLSLSGGEVNAAATRLAATDSTTIRLYRLSAPPPAIAVEPRCDLTGPNGSFFRPTWSPDGVALAWQEDDGIWVGSFDIESCQGSARLVIPGGRAPDWGPADVSTPASAANPNPSPVADTRPPAVKMTVIRRVSRVALLRGLKVKASCDEPCRLTAELLLDRRTAKRRRPAAARSVPIGRASRRLTKAGTATLTLRPTTKARPRLRHGRLRSVIVRAWGVDGAGNRSKTVMHRVAVHG
jgi:hypothetical protein